MEHFYSYVDYCVVDRDVNCTMKVESAICEQVVIFLTYQKQKKIYICSTRKISNKNDFLLLWENKYNVQVWSSGQLRSKEFEKKKTLILAFEEKL